ncbi:MAG: tyrosine-type recombinase/integrase, partial [Thermoplasmata archaeon]
MVCFLKRKSDENTGKAPRIIGLPQSLSDRLHEYIDKYRSKTDPVALFTTEKGRMNYGWARNIIKLIAKRAGIPRFHAHAARHWCATALLRDAKDGRRLDIREVQIHLGHASLASTQVYTHIKSMDVAKRASEHMGEFFRMNKI